MKNKLKVFYQKYSFLKVVFNPFIFIGVFFVMWLTFFDTYSYFEHKEVDKELDKLKTNEAYFTSEINKDKKKIQRLKNPLELERYAREKYYMKRTNEDIYIIEIAEDSLIGQQE